MPSPVQQDFKSYLSSSLNGQFLVSLREAPLLSVVEACATAKSRIRPKFKDSFRCLIYNLRALEDECQVQLMPIQVTDVFWGYFITFCQLRKLAASTIQTLVNQLRSVLTWAVKYGALVSPTYTDIRLHKTQSHEIALTADEVSRVAYFDVQRFYADRRPAYRATMERVRDMFVLSCNLGQRHSDMVRIEPSCFERNMFRITQQKTGNLAVVNIDTYAVDAKTTYRLLEKYGYFAPYTSAIGNYNFNLHALFRDIDFNDVVRIEEKRSGGMVVENLPKWKLVSSHTARRTFATVNVLRGHNIHSIKKATGHSDLRCLELYVRDE